MQPYLYVDLEDDFYEPARKAIRKKLGAKAKASEDLRMVLSQDERTLYLADSVIRAHNLGVKDPSDVIEWPAQDGNGTVTLYRWIVDRDFPSDCGQAARKVMSIVNGISETEKYVTTGPSGIIDTVRAPRSVPHVSGSDVQRLGRNQFAKPGIGEAYVVIPPGSHKKTGVQFHWGAVVARSGNEVITLEGFAGFSGDSENLDANRGWSFGIYSQDENTPLEHQTFHGFWQILVEGVQTYVAVPQSVYLSGTASVSMGSTSTLTITNISNNTTNINNNNNSTPTLPSIPPRTDTLSGGSSSLGSSSHLAPSSSILSTGGTSEIRSVSNLLAAAGAALSNSQPVEALKRVIALCNKNFLKKIYEDSRVQRELQNLLGRYYDAFRLEWFLEAD